MRKFVLIPVASLGRQAEGQLLEIMSEPAHFGGVNMDALKSCGLDKNITTTKDVLSRINAQPSGSTLYLTGYLTNVSNTLGINLGLLVACFMQVPSCPYQKVIVAGQLEVNQTSFPVTETGYFAAKLQAILNLGKQSEPLPFFFPQVMQAENQAQLAQLEALNIVLKPITQVSDVLIDFGIMTQ
jgi:hypothetical protein